MAGQWMKTFGFTARLCRVLGACALAWGGVVVLGVLGAVGAGPASAQSASAQSVSGTLNAVTCPTATSCVAVGQNAAGTEGIVVPISNGIPGSTQLVSGTLDLNGIACPDASDCVAVGRAAVSEGVVVPITNGTPGNAGAVSGATQLNGVACSTASDCFAVGQEDTSFPPPGVVLPVTNGIPASPQLVSAQNLGLNLTGVACSSVTSCVAVGEDLTTSSSGEGAVVPITSGTAGGEGLAGGNALNSVACTATGNCIAVGNDQPMPLQPVGFIVPITGPGMAQDIAGMPTLSGIACPGSDNCIAIGGGLGNAGEQILPITNGSPGQVIAASPGTPILAAIACGDASSCVGVGGSSVVSLTPPTTSVLLPSNGATISGGTWLDAGASSPVGIASVTFEVSGGSVSGQMVGTGVLTLYGWIGGWDATDVPNGTYTLQSVATDKFGNSTTSAGVTVTVDNPPLQTAVIVPSNGATLSGSAAVLDASAIGTSDVTSVQFIVNGGSLSNHVVGTATLTLYGWIAEWDTTGTPNGTYTLQSVATEVGGTTATSSALNVTVQN
jgi:hypothetical protein